MSLKYWSFSAFGQPPGLGVYSGSACGESRPVLVSLPKPPVTADVRKRFRANSLGGESKLERKLSRAEAGLGKRGRRGPVGPRSLLVLEVEVAASLGSGGLWVAWMGRERVQLLGKRGCAELCTPAPTCLNCSDSPVQWGGRGTKLSGWQWSDSFTFR